MEKFLIDRRFSDAAKRRSTQAKQASKGNSSTNKNLLMALKVIS